MEQKDKLFPNIHAELARAGLDASTMADYLGITRQAIYNKLGGKTSFTLKDMKLIQSFFQAKGCGSFTLDYLFTNGG